MTQPEHEKTCTDSLPNLDYMLSKSRKSTQKEASADMPQHKKSLYSYASAMESEPGFPSDSPSRELSNDFDVGWDPNDLEDLPSLSDLLHDGSMQTNNDGLQNCGNDPFSHLGSLSDTDNITIGQGHSSGLTQTSHLEASSSSRVDITGTGKDETHSSPRGQDLPAKSQHKPVLAHSKEWDENLNSISPGIKANDTPSIIPRKRVQALLDGM
jgi:hypothetical protein